ncbi:MAG TPA: SoxR reducing system RseC family protein [Desulfosalsimonadaceae bacterium]|nr:SoxR reducing system RseC family protein [Desulfosalsimonadaceae bacterium]
MALEEAIITRTNRNTAVVQTRRTAACEGCSERHVCHSMGGNREIEVEVANPVGAEPGDTVMVAFKTSQLVLLSFLLYVFPIIAMVIGAVLGDSLAPRYNADPSIFAAVLGFLFFAAAMGIIIWKDRQVKKTGQYQPVIVEIKRKGPPGGQAGSNGAAESNKLSGCTICRPD